MRELCLTLTCGIHLERFCRVFSTFDALVPKELLQLDEIWFLDLVLEDFEPAIEFNRRAKRGRRPINRAYQLFPMVSHSRPRSLFSSSDSDSV